MYICIHFEVEWIVGKNIVKKLLDPPISTNYHVYFIIISIMYHMIFFATKYSLISIYSPSKTQLEIRMVCIKHHY